MCLTAILRVAKSAGVATGIFNPLFKYREQECFRGHSPHILFGVGVSLGDVYVILSVAKNHWAIRLSMRYSAHGGMSSSQTPFFRDEMDRGNARMPDA